MVLTMQSNALNISTWSQMRIYFTFIILSLKLKDWANLNEQSPQKTTFKCTYKQRPEVLVPGFWSRGSTTWRCTWGSRWRRVACPAGTARSGQPVCWSTSRSSRGSPPPPCWSCSRNSCPGTECPSRMTRRFLIGRCTRVSLVLRVQTEEICILVFICERNSFTELDDT